ncbi:hypothetical protein GWI33_006245 [Rhynchophorus ferrugineus]|uniref:Uncharacterized protein n=1 Tax=Rhynchophorus ferrugineus TaxID=354439 RepID=A0A834IHZ0_RHYFE|nr:hypothetical protein GWI33_006245 [Rhynchophorus ferrugineus]
MSIPAGNRLPSLTYPMSAQVRIVSRSVNMSAMLAPAALNNRPKLSCHGGHPSAPKHLRYYGVTSFKTSGKLSGP